VRRSFACLHLHCKLFVSVFFSLFSSLFLLPFPLPLWDTSLTYHACSAKSDVVMAFQRPNPLLIPELARMLCEFVDQADLLNLALTCKFLFYPACERLWKRLNPRSLVALRKIKNTLDGKYKRPFSINYNSFVWEFLWTASNDQRAARFERDFFHIFRFPAIQRLEFSVAAAQDVTVCTMMARHEHLEHVDFSHCYCLTTDAIRPLLDMPPGQLKSLILYGCGQIDRRALVYLIHRHSSSLTRIGLTDINDQIMYAIQQCHQLQSLGLEHCSDMELTEDAITAFCKIMKTRSMRLEKLRVRDIQSLTTEHVSELAHTCADTLRHLDMSECIRVSHTAFLDLAMNCTRLETFSIGYQAEVTNAAISVSTLMIHSFGKMVVGGRTSSQLRKANRLTVCACLLIIFTLCIDLTTKLYASQAFRCSRMLQAVQ
jgi:hypothetical protein